MSATISVPDKQTVIIEQLQELIDLHRQILEEPPLKSQAIVEFLLQGFAVLIGVLFGAFSILAWQAAVTSNSLSNNSINVATSANALAQSGNYLATSANDLAGTANNAAATANALAYCQLASNSDAACATLQSILSRSVSRLVAPVFSTSASSTGVAAPTSSPTSTAAPGPLEGSRVLSDGAIGGIVAGIVVLLSLGALGYTSRAKYLTRMSRYRQVRQVQDNVAALR